MTVFPGRVRSVKELRFGFEFNTEIAPLSIDVSNLTYVSNFLVAINYENHADLIPNVQTVCWTRNARTTVGNISHYAFQDLPVRCFSERGDSGAQ